MNIFTNYVTCRNCKEIKLANNINVKKFYSLFQLVYFDLCCHIKDFIYLFFSPLYTS